MLTATDRSNERERSHNEEQQRCQHLINVFCDQYRLNPLYVTTYLNHLTNHTYSLIEQIVTSSRAVVLERSETFDPRDLQEEYVFCLLQGKATLRRMTVEWDGRDTCANKSSVKELSTFVALYNYRTHQNNQFYVLDCEAHSELLFMRVPDNLTHSTYRNNAHKLSFLSQFLVSKQAASKNTLHAYMSLFSKNTYVKGTYLTRYLTPADRVGVLVEGMCSYSRSVKPQQKGKQIALFTCGTKSIIGAQLLAQKESEHKGLASYTICVESSHAELYEIKLEDTPRLPRSMLQAFSGRCMEEYRSLLKLASTTISKSEYVLNETERKAQEDRQAIHSNVEMRSSPTLKKQEFDDKLYEMMCSRVKDDRNAQLEKKIAMNLNEITRSRSSTERLTDFKQILGQKINEKEELKKAAVEQQAEVIEELFESQIATVFDNQNEEKEQLMVKTQIERYSSLLARKDNLVDQHVEDKTPLLLLKAESRIDSKSFKLKMLRKGFLREDYETFLRQTHHIKQTVQYDPNANNYLTRVPIEEKIGRIKREYTKKINITNRIKEQCVTIRSGFVREEPVKLDVVKGYQSMKELEFQNVVNRSRNNSLSSHRQEETDYGLLLKMLQRTQRREESLERVHQKVRFLKKRTLTPYNHSSHLKESARLHRYSVSSMKKHRNGDAN